MNFHELNNELIAVRESLAGRDRLCRDLERIERSLKEQRPRLEALAAELSSEQADVRRLEGMSLVGLFYSVMGSRDSRLEVERRELLAAQLKHDNALRTVETLERDAADVRGRLAGLKDLDGRRAALLAEKEAILRSAGSPALDQLDALDMRLAGAHTRQRELNEAVLAGQRAEDALRRAVEALESAQGWGTWDLLGGGMLSSAVKHSRLDEAHAAVQESQPLLVRFERELTDVGGSLGLDVETGGLTAFADIFIDGLLIDLLVQSRIGESLDAARGMYERVRSLLARLSRQQSEALREAQELETQRKALVDNA